MTKNAELDEQARAILRRNDRGGYTVPTLGLYPFQWNWDSAFVALGFATFDRDRAWQEIETLVSGQWDDGMIPHIIFHQADDGYFPGPEIWATGKTPSTSGITQPPVLASVVRQLWQDEGGDPRLHRPRRDDGGRVAREDELAHAGDSADARLDGRREPGQVPEQR